MRPSLPHRGAKGEAKEESKTYIKDPEGADGKSKEFKDN